MMSNTTDISSGDRMFVNINDQFPWLDQFRPGNQLVKGAAYRWTKRIMDLTLVIIGLPFAVLIGILCVFLINLESPGSPAIFAQERTGKGGKRFKMYKFRTMVVNADELKKELAHLNELQWPDFKISNDPRITKIGKIMRKTSLDELPQLINILRGEMSMVGPRPTSFSVTNYKLWHTERLDVMPGLTGLWQLAGRGETEFDERLRLDIAYIERRCIWLDIQILLRTITAVIQQRGAY